MYPGQNDCWAADIYQKCVFNKQHAYDTVNEAGGNTNQAYCYYQALLKTRCAKKPNGEFQALVLIYKEKYNDKKDKKKVDEKTED